MWRKCGIHACALCCLPLVAIMIEEEGWNPQWENKVLKRTQGWSFESASGLGESRMPSKISIRPGTIFGRLVVLEETENTGCGRTAYSCFCVCGNTVTVTTKNLRNGHTKSCGCLRRDPSADYRRGSLTHGKSKTPEYRAWSSIKRRCMCPQHPFFRDYGGRGISICPEWSASYEAFLRDVGGRPSSSHSIDRIDNNGNYEPGNVRWATRKEQRRNIRNNRYITAFGRTLLLIDWASETGICEETLVRRLQLGWEAEEIVSVKPGQRRK